MRLKENVITPSRIGSSRTTLLRYCVIVAAIYFVVFLAAVLFLDRAEAPSAALSLRLWSLPLAGAAMSLFVTWVTIARFGNMGGSIYFTPTVTHATLIIVLVFALIRTL